MREQGSQINAEIIMRKALQLHSEVQLENPGMVFKIQKQNRTENSFITQRGTLCRAAATDYVDDVVDGYGNVG